MWFKNLQIYRLPHPWNVTRDVLDESLQGRLFHPCGSQDARSLGFTPPRAEAPDRLVHAVGGHWLLQLTIEERLLPAAVIQQEANERAAKKAEEQGYPLGKKALRELKERISEELLPRAFTRRRRTALWIDPENGWLGVDAASLVKAEEALETLRDALGELPLTLVRTQISPTAAMADWLAAGEASAGFVIDRDCELVSAAEEKSAVRYVRHPLNDESVSAEIRAHLAAGKFPVKLALTFDDRLSFLLTEKGEIKRLAFLDVVKEESETLDAAEVFDAEFALQSGEFTRLLPALMEALGGEIVEKGAGNAPQ
ncbi:MAG: recombination-associated protein RdgC [Zoogloeaceae bacterium]|jgi:recombination associated protein RdgC|nr:recombination-associated protein RdgC [Zoogloeaceae bacterium]